MIRLLVDAGADPTLPVQMANSRGGGGVLHNTPLALAKYLWLEKKNVDRTEVTDEQKRMLEGTRRFFTCVEAVHAVSWLWAKDAPSTARPVKGTSTTRTTCGHWSLMVSLMKPGGGARRSKLAAIFRYSAKPSSIKFIVINGPGVGGGEGVFGPLPLSLTERIHGGARRPASIECSAVATSATATATHQRSK